MTSPTLSIVIPIYNEARILKELVTRCATAAHQCVVPFELVIVDDASSDDTPTLLASLTSDACVRSCRLPSNAGQFRATQAGLREASGLWIVVLDGDLQDPPEYIPRLVAALSSADASVMAVLAVKSHRDDPRMFMLGQFVFHRLQGVLSPVAVPRGAGSYSIMRRAVARRVATADLGRANLAAVIAVAAHALGGRLATIPYEKGPRYDDRSRVAWRGLVTEALESLAITGALSRLLGLVAIGLATIALLVDSSAAGRAVIFAGSAIAAVLSFSTSGRSRRALATLGAPHDDA